MNSKERRKDRRKWKYHVRYPEYGDGPIYDERWDWCVATFGNTVGRCWREKHGHISDYWEFDNEQAYFAFVLKFGAGISK